MYLIYKSEDWVIETKKSILMLCHQSPCKGACCYILAERFASMLCKQTNGRKNAPSPPPVWPQGVNLGVWELSEAKPWGCARAGNLCMPGTPRSCHTQDLHHAYICPTPYLGAACLRACRRPTHTWIPLEPSTAYS